MLFNMIIVTGEHLQIPFGVDINTKGPMDAVSWSGN